MDDILEPFIAGQADKRIVQKVSGTNDHGRLRQAVDGVKGAGLEDGRAEHEKGQGDLITEIDHGKL